MLQLRYRYDFIPSVIPSSHTHTHTHAHAHTHTHTHAYNRRRNKKIHKKKRKKNKKRKKKNNNNNINSIKRTEEKKSKRRRRGRRRQRGRSIRTEKCSTILIRYTYRTSSQSSPLHNQPSRTFELLHATLEQNDCTHSWFPLTL